MGREEKNKRLGELGVNPLSFKLPLYLGTRYLPHWGTALVCLYINSPTRLCLRTVFLPYLFLSPQNLKQCLLHNRCSINVKRMAFCLGATLLKTITESRERKERNQNGLFVLYVSHIITDTFGYTSLVAIV